MSDQDNKAIGALKGIVLENLKERRRSRRWGIFFKISYIVLAAFVLMLFMDQSDDGQESIDAEKITAVVDVSGIIMDGADAGADRVMPSLKKAFEHNKTKGVVIRINSPGGSPVQSAYINDEIRRLKEKHKIPVYAVVSDICASGGYYIAVATDKIYANKGSIVGSIGVRMDGFGFVEAMQDLGVERRLLTAGEHKAILDPFSPISEKEQQHVKTMLAHTHKQFIDVVKKGRGKRLKNNPDIFTGLFWTGEDAKQLGLIDGLASTEEVARKIIGAEEIVVFTDEKDLFEKLTDRVSTQLITTLMNLSISKPTLR